MEKSMNNENRFEIGNMDCANCAKEVETGVRRLDGIEAVEVNFASGMMTVKGAVPFSVLQNRVEALGKTITPEGALQEQKTAVNANQPGGILGFFIYMKNRADTRFALVGGLVIISTLFASLLGLAQPWVSALYSLGMVTTLLPILKSGVNGLRINRQFNINLLMSIAAIGAILIGEFLESAVVIFLFSVGEALEGFTASQARRSIKGLMALKPKTAVLLTPTGEKEVAVEALQIGEQIVVKPGENIPMDGRIISGQSGINQAPITGESIPVDKVTGDDVFASSINGNGTLTVEITRLAKDNTLNRIIRMVEEAQGSKASSQRIIDRFAAWYTPAVVLLAILVAALPPLLFDAPLFDTAAGHGWLYRALAMLVIACPCALIISTPVTVISAITAAAKKGVLIKGGMYLETLGQIQAFAFDKTGTLTQGKPQVTSFKGIDCLRELNCACCEEVLAMATAVEKRTSHPLAEAVVKAASERQLDGMFEAATAVEQLTGMGVKGWLGENEILVGSHSLFDAKIPHSDSFCDEIRAVEQKGETAVLLAKNGRARGYITIADTPRPTAQRVINELNELNIATIMLTGDNKYVAQTIGQQVGVTDVRAGLLPEEKLAAINELKETYGAVAMTGDGINDTPALAAATVGIAMGGAGSPQALETADVALMADDLTQLPFAVKLSRFAFKLIRQNVIISFGVKAVFLTLAFLGLTSLWVAILADVGMSLLVTLNGMRPLKKF